jgi:hypothetical protein
MIATVSGGRPRPFAVARSCPVPSANLRRRDQAKTSLRDPVDEDSPCVLARVEEGNQRAPAREHAEIDSDDRSAPGAGRARSM